MKKMLTIFSSIALISTAGLAVVSCDDNRIDIIQGSGVKIDLTFDVSSKTDGGFDISSIEDKKGDHFEWNDEDGDHKVNVIHYTDEISTENIISTVTLGDYLLYNEELFDMHYTLDPIFGVFATGFFGVVAENIMEHSFAFNEYAWDSETGENIWRPANYGVSSMILSTANTYSFVWQ